MSASTIVEDLITYLELEKAAGRDTVYLSPQVRREFFADFSPSSRTAAARSGHSAEGEKTIRSGDGGKPAPRSESVSGNGVQDRAKEHLAEASTAVTSPVQPRIETPSIRASSASLDWPALEESVLGCHGCGLHRTRAKPLFEQGGRHAELMLIGDSPPGHEVAAMLARMVAAMRFKPEEVYLTNIVKCQTPGGRWPDQSEVQACVAYLHRQIELVRPRAIVLLGAMAMECLLGQKSITRWRGRWQRCHDIPTMAVYHPRFMMKHRQAKAEAWQDLQCVMRFCGRQTNA